MSKFTERGVQDCWFQHNLQMQENGNNCPPKMGCLKILGCIKSVVYFAAIKNDDTVPHLLMWIDVHDILN